MSGSLGFTWRPLDAESLAYQSPDGRFKRVNRTLHRSLLRLASGQLRGSELEPAQREALQVLQEQDFVRPYAPVVRAPDPAQIRLWPGAALLLLTLAALAALVAQRFSWASLAGLSWWHNLWAIPAFTVSALVHELGHYLAARPYFRPRVGFGMASRIFPVLVTHTNQAWACSRSVRIWISIAGPLAEALLTCVVALVHLLLLPQHGFLSVVLFFQLLRIFFALNPLVESDGYWLLSDLFGIVNLRTTGIRHLRRRQITPQSLYVLLSGVFIAAVLLFAGRFVWLLVFA